MDNVKIIYGVLGATSVFLLILSIFLGVTVADLNDDKRKWKNKAVSYQKQVESLESQLTRKKDNISELQMDISELKSDKKSLQQKVNRAMLFAGSPIWYKEKDGDYYLTFSVYNFGKTSATDVEAKFIVFKSSDANNKVVTKKLDVGNVASGQIYEPEYSLNIDKTLGSDATGYMEITRCDSCLKLSERVNILQQFGKNQGNRNENSNV